MNKEDIRSFINKYPDAYLATAAGKKPHVRLIRTVRADDDGIIFCLYAPKDTYKQVVQNPYVEVCYHAEGLQIRIAGKMTPVEDMRLKKEIVEKRPSLKSEVDNQGWDYLKVFAINQGKATIFDIDCPIATPGEPKVWIEL
jgi:uncharacterized pyridoxamine 5'-phosphate oxidase family protein